MREAQIIGVAALVALAITPILIAAGRRGVLLDRPNARSSHVRPTPRAGGIAIVAGFLAAAIPFSTDAHASTIVFVAVAMAALGFADDLVQLGALPRLAAQLAAGSVVVLVVGRFDVIALGPYRLSLGSLAPVATVIWIAGVMNFYNFMDGIDGLAAGQAVLAAALVIAAGWSATATLLAAALAGAMIGFLPFNWPRAKIFMGDVGSMPIGFLLAVLPLLAPPSNRPAALPAMAIGLALFLLDPTVTLIRRTLRRDRIGESHREHAYQQFVAPGSSHLKATASLLCAIAVLSVAGAIAFRRPDAAPLAALLAVVVYLIEFALAERSRRKA